MKHMFVVRRKSKCFLLFLLFLQFTLDIAVLFDIPVMRQVIGFLCLTFVPGLIIVKLLKLDELDSLELVLFSAGFSVASLILAGLLVNEFGFFLGVSHPLSQVPLMITLNSLVLLGGILVYLRSEDVEILKSGPIEKSPIVMLFLCLPILSIIGAIYASAYGNNLLLLFMIMSISVLFIVGVLSKKLLPSKLYPFALLMIAIALLFHSALISKYIVPYGSDVPGEYFIFKTVESNAYWSSTLPSSMGIWYGRMNDMLSITILPTFYANILNFDPAWVFKMLYPLIFSLVPLGLYQIWQTHIGKKYAFISAFLFVALETFYNEMLGLNRQMIAELFFVLLLLVIVNKKMKRFNKMIIFTVFSFALVASHYALALIFLFFISFALVSLIVLKRPSKNITVFMVVLFFVVMFAWYIYTSHSATFDSISEFGNKVYQQLGDFFSPASRGETVLTGLGLAESPSIWNTISRMFAYLVEALIVFGFVGVVTKRTSIHIEDEFFIFSLIALAFLAMLILVPGLANTLDMTRFYHILLFFLAPLCVVGGDFIVKLLSKRKREFAVAVLLLIVLVPYFLFQTEFVFEVTGSDSWSIPLSGYRMDALRLHGSNGYTDAYSVYGAQWLSNNVDVKNTAIYADQRTLTNVLTMYGMVYQGNSLSNTTIVPDKGVVYLGTLNVVYGAIPFGQSSCNTSELFFIFDESNMIYANGGSQIYRVSP